MRGLTIFAIAMIGIFGFVMISIATEQFGLAIRTNPNQTPECGNDIGREIGTANGTWHFGGYICSNSPCSGPSFSYPFGRCY